MTPERHPPARRSPPPTGSHRKLVVTFALAAALAFPIPALLSPGRREMPRSRTAPSLLLACVLLSTAACGGEQPAADLATTLPPTPAEHSRGETLYDANCASCHGPKGTGTTLGPPLVHIVYEPGHHGDAAFQMAVQRGVAAHHWRFGNMPPQPQVGREETDAIIGYVRWLQRQAGIE